MDLHILRSNLGLGLLLPTPGQRPREASTFARPLSLRRTKTPPRGDTACKLGAGTALIG